MEITKENVFKLVCELPDKKLETLKRYYKDLFGQSAVNNKDALLEKIAYRMQEIAYGGLSKNTRNKLAECLAYKPNIDKPTLAPGSIIRKTYKGQDYEVEVCENHYIYDNLQYKSLSAIAKKITGTNWNGRVFFDVK